MAAPAKLGSPKRSGLIYWADQVLKEVSRAADGFAPDPVHDLRVALRRCRSMAEVAQSFDPDPAWRKMRKSGKQIFSSLGDLRDCQILIEWVERLSSEDDPVRFLALTHLRNEESRLKVLAAEALRLFDATQWQRWSNYLTKRIQRHQLGGELYQGLALGRWHDAQRLHRAAVRSRSKIALHRLRIGVKKFRYVVENFLPALHDQIGKSLKEVQDLLGEVHDLDVLSETLVRIHAIVSPDARSQWSEKIRHERRRRVERYREVTRAGIWQQWRSPLPTGTAALRASRKRIQVWSSLQDPDPLHSRRVATIALKIYDFLIREKFLRTTADNSREILFAAATMHDVGKSDKGASRPKRSYKKIARFTPPSGWSSQDLQIAAGVARYHRGALPVRADRALRGMAAGARHRTTQLAAILRLADALEYAQRKRTPLSLKREEHHIVITSAAVVDGGRQAEDVARARYLLELVSGVPILVRGASRRSIHRNPAKTF